MEILQTKTITLCQTLHDSTMDLLNEAIQHTENDNAHSKESVHRLRVLLKKLRAHQQLVQPLVPPRSMDYANLRMKKIADILSGRRDKDVLMTTHAKLIKKTKSKKATKSLKALENLLDQIREEDNEPIAWSKIRNPIKVESAFWKRNIQKWPTGSDESLILGLTTTYRKARKRFRSAYEDKDRNRYHDWRKWAKYLLYQLEFFNSRLGSKYEKRIQALTRLGKLLGNHQDLQVYRKHIHQVSAHDFSSDQLARCDVLIRQKEKTLESQCKKIGDRWFKEKPSQFEQRNRRKCFPPNGGAQAKKPSTL